MKSSQPLIPYNERLAFQRRLIMVLILILIILIYLYLNLAAPPVPITEAPTPGITPVFAIYGWQDERLSAPNAVATDDSGKIYVTDTRNHRIAVFNRSGAFLYSFGKLLLDPKTKKALPGSIVFPSGIAVAENGDIYVTSARRSTLMVFSNQGKLRREIPVDRPISVMVDKEKVYVSTPGQIWVFSLKGELLNRFGSKGRRLGEFEYPAGLAVDNKGYLFVSDTNNHRLQIFTPRGELYAYKGTPPKSLNDSGRYFGLNTGLVFDSQQRLYVVDTFRHSIRIFNHDGNELAEVGQEGDAEGHFNYPSGIAYLGGSLFAVADKWNDRVQVVRIVVPQEDTVIRRAIDSRWPLYLLVGLLFLILLLLWQRHQRQKSLQSLQQLKIKV